MTTATSTRTTEIHQNVLTLLERYPEARDDDSALMVRYWADIDGLVFDYTFPTRFISQGTNPESITRARRTIQNKLGLFQPSQDAAATRRQRQAEMREHFAHANG